MNLRWKAFEKAVGNRVKDYDARNRMTFWQRLSHHQTVDVQLWWFRCAPTLILAGIALFNTRAITNHPEGWMAGIGVWAWLVTAARTGNIWGAAQLDREYRLAWVLPMSPERILQRLIRGVMAGSGFLFFEFLLVYGVLAAGANHRIEAWTGAVACAAIQAGFSLALTFLIVAVRINASWLIVPVFLFLYLGGYGSMFLKKTAFFLTVLQTCNPLAWLNAVYWEGWLRDSVTVYWVLLPLVLVFGAFPFSLRVIRRLHYEGAFSDVGARGGGLILATKGKPGPPPTDLATERQRILAGDFDPLPPLAQQGFVERLIARFLNPRERDMVGMFLLSSRPWTDNFLSFLVYLALFLAASGLAYRGSLDSFAMSLFFANRGNRIALAALLFICFLLFSMMLAKGVFMFGWPRVWPEWVTGSQGRRASPYRGFRLLPLNYWEVAVVVAKTNFPLALLLVPPTVIFSQSPLLLTLQERVPFLGLAGLKGVLVIWSFALLSLALKLSVSFLNELKYWRSFLKTVLVCILFFMTTIGLMAARSLWLGALSGGGLVLATLLWFLYCGACYREGRPI